MSAPAWESEAALCAGFVAALPEGWTAYAETAGWDLLLVRDADGFQVGVEAKLRLNAKVLVQALEGNQTWVQAGPDCRAVLVPKRQPDLAAIALFLGVVVLECPAGPLESWRDRFRPKLPRERDHSLDAACGRWPEWCPMARCALPEYVPDVGAGNAAPVQLTQWKIRAIRIAILLARRGGVTRDDFRHVGIDARRWLPQGAGWLVARDGRFVAGPALPDFAGQHPTVYAQIDAEFDSWAPLDVPVAREGRA